MLNECGQARTDYATCAADTERRDRYLRSPGNLLLEIEVRADRERDALPAFRILKSPHLRNAINLTITGRIDVGEHSSGRNPSTSPQILML
jgi:hypothetical protein